ncbi:MAG: restriction endonuclease subunit S [Pseudomonadota bacterium]
MNKWKEIFLGGVLQFQRGFDITKKQQAEGEIPIISSSGITSYHNKAKAKGPGVITGRKGTLGKVHYVKSDYWPHDTTLWIKNFKGNNPRFLYYYLMLMHFENYDTGSSNPTLNRNHLHKLKVKIPSPTIQQKIAAILSAYDDLIENNNRRIALLEKMAEESYREWFVRMRFPGHEKVKFHKGLPEGWEINRLGNIVNLLMGQSPKSIYYNTTGDGLPFHQGVGTYGNRFPKIVIFCSVKGRVVKKGDVLISVRAPVGRLNIADCKMIIGRGLAAMSHKRGYNSYLFYMLKNVFSCEDIIGNGAVFNSVGKEELKGMKILVPNDVLIKKYNDIAEKIDKNIENIQTSVELLNNTRDKLLPRLISGKLSVEDLDIRFPDSMLEESRAELHQ